MNILQEFSILFLIVSGGVTIFLGYHTYMSDRESATKKIFLALCLAIPIWLVVFTASTRPDIVGDKLLLFMRVSLVFSIVVNLLFVMIAQTFPSRTYLMQSRYVLPIILVSLAVGIIAYSPYTFTGVTIEAGEILPSVGPGMLAYALFNFVAYMVTFVIFRRRLTATTVQAERKALFSLGVGMFLMISLMFFTISLPVALYNFTLFLPLAPLYALLFIVFVTYGILKHKLFDVKVVAVEIFVAIISVVFLARIFTSRTWTESLPDLFIFFATLFFGFLLVRSVKQEIKAREEIKHLADQLSITVGKLEESNEQLRIIDLRKSEFVSIVSHQLRTPITAIKGYTSLILEESFGPITERLKAPVQKIFSSSSRLAQMVSDYLDISKIEQGTMSYTFSPVDIGAMIRDLGDDFVQVAAKKGLGFSVHIPEGRNFIATADDGKIRQIFSNLIDNSIKYTPTGKVELYVDCDDEKGTVFVKIVDTGIGLSQEDIHHLFGKFTRGSEGQRQNTEGSGLGLYVARKMLEAQKGTVWVDSEGPGKGSTFCVELTGHK